MNEKEKNLAAAVRERTLGFVTGALGLVAGLAWNEAIKALIEVAFPLGKDTLLAKFVYAIIVTIVVVVASIYLAKLFNRNSKKEA